MEERDTIQPLRGVKGVFVLVRETMGAQVVGSVGIGLKAATY